MAKPKTKFSQGQLNRASEISGNLAVAWFSAGIIYPLLTRSQNIIELLTNLGVSLFIATLFTILSLYLAKGVK